MYSLGHASHSFNCISVRVCIFNCSTATDIQIIPDLNLFQLPRDNWDDLHIYNKTKSSCFKNMLELLRNTGISIYYIIIYKFKYIKPQKLKIKAL